MTSNMTIYARPSEIAWINDRISCCSGDARKTTVRIPPLPAPAVAAAGEVVRKPARPFLIGRAVALCAASPPEADAATALAAAAWVWNPRSTQSSYSLPRRRRASMAMTRRIEPMHEAAKAPLLETCHDSARKPDKKKKCQIGRSPFVAWFPPFFFSLDPARP